MLEAQCQDYFRSNSEGLHLDFCPEKLPLKTSASQSTVSHLSSSSALNQRGTCLYQMMSFSVPSSTTLRCCRTLLRNLSKPSAPSRCIRLSSSSTHIYSRRRASRTNTSRRWASTEALAAAAPVNPKISGIVDQISQLTLLETADLVSSLKVRSIALWDCLRSLSVVIATHLESG